MTTPEYWTALHLSQANAAGPGQADLPMLLRRVAQTIEELGPVDVHDLVLHNEVTSAGNWYSITVYFDRNQG